MTLTLPIVIGKRYLRRDGRVVTVRKADPIYSHDLVFVGEGAPSTRDSEQAYVDTGRVSMHTKEYPLDLVADHPEATAHPHWLSMKLYADDAAETAQPWERWENRNARAGSVVWSANVNHPEWNPALEYRRKPRIIRIGEFDVPEPLRQPVADGGDYWLVQIVEGTAGAVECTNFTPSKGLWHVATGLVHLTREAAELHARALISLTEQTR